MTILVDKQIDSIFNQVDDQLLEGNFGVVDDWLEQLDVDTMSSDIIAAWLSITLAAREKLHNRADFVVRAEARLVRLGSNQINRLMDGLR